MEIDPHTPAAGCTLDTGPCPGPACALWDLAAGACVLHGAEPEVLAHPAVAAHLLELRRALDTVSATLAEEERTHFFHRLNLENTHPGGTP